MKFKLLNYFITLIFQLQTNKNQIFKIANGFIVIKIHISV